MTVWGGGACFGLGEWCIGLGDALGLGEGDGLGEGGGLGDGEGGRFDGEGDGLLDGEGDGVSGGGGGGESSTEGLEPGPLVRPNGLPLIDWATTEVTWKLAPPKAPLKIVEWRLRSCADKEMAKPFALAASALLVAE